MHKAVFLDKDGTLIEDVPYNIDPEKIELTEGCEKALDLLRLRGYQLIVVSNQPGIARGSFQMHDLKKAENALVHMLARCDVRLDGFYYCPHHSEGSVGPYNRHCTCRKPEAGLIIQAAEERHIDLAASWLIGDILNDVEAGKRAGCRTILINNGNETEWVLSPQRMPDHIVPNVLEAAEIICLRQ